MEKEPKTFIEAYRAWREKYGFTHEQVMWFHTLCFSFYVYVIVAFYTAGINGMLISRQVNVTVGYVSLVLILLSMAMSSICYFWNFADRYLQYRKYFGVVGFMFAFVHFVISFTLIQTWAGIDKFLANPENIIPFYTGLGSLLLLTFLTVISYHWAIKAFGAEWWRRLLRFGYLALILGVVHTAARGGGDWMLWLTGKADYLFPPFGLLMATGTIVIILLRIAMYIDIKRNHLRK